LREDIEGGYESGSAAIETNENNVMALQLGLDILG